jgi:hypothetical protein
MTIHLFQGRPSRIAPVRFSLICLCVLAVSLTFAACSKKNNNKERPLSKSAQMLVNPPSGTSDAVLLHTVDSATEFPAALNSLEPDVPKPEVRSVSQFIPGNSGAGGQTVEVVQPVRASVPLKKDWGGVILVPDMDRMSRGFTSRVTLTRIEAHPIADDYFRVWVRVRNDAKQDIEADVACNFRGLDQQVKETDFIPIKIAAGASANAYFISPMPNVAYYTILVR